MKNSGDWFFDDGIVMFNDICFMDNINYLGENRLRFWVKDLECVDYYENEYYDFICEYYYSFK